MLFIIAGADILLHEVTTFVDRLKKDAVVLNSQRDSSADSDSTSYEIEGMVFDNMLHGWLDRKWLAYLLPPAPTFSLPMRASIACYIFFYIYMYVYIYTEPNLRINILCLIILVPSFIIDENLRTQALDASYDFIRRIHAENGWHNDKRTKKET